MLKSFRCPECGFFFSTAVTAVDLEEMSEEERREVTACPCGAQMEEVPFSLDMIPTIVFSELE